MERDTQTTDHKVLAGASLEATVQPHLRYAQRAPTLLCEGVGGLLKEFYGLMLALSVGKNGVADGKGI